MDLGGPSMQQQQMYPPQPTSQTPVQGGGNMDLLGEGLDSLVSIFIIKPFWLLWCLSILDSIVNFIIYMYSDKKLALLLMKIHILQMLVWAWLYMYKDSF